jgi:hypothetical protein
MLLVWGRRWYTRRLGFVADFCEICRRPQPFKLERRSLIGHFWYLPMGTTHAVRHLGRCTRCTTEVATQFIRYAQVVKKKAASTRDLLATTLPDHERVLQQRMEAERIVREDVTALSPAVRRDLLARPFVTLSPMVEQRFATLQLDGWAAVALLSLFVFPPLMRALFSVVAPDNMELGLLAGLGLSIALVLWTGIGAKRRWIRKFIAPRLADSLAPLRATGAEVEGILAELRAHKHKMGKYVKPADLQRQRVRAS